MIENYSANNLVKVIDKEDITDLVQKIKASDNPTNVAIELAVFGFQYCEKLKEKNFQIYQNNVAPKMVRLDCIKKKLELEGLKPETENELLSDLIIVEKEIKEEGKAYDKSILEKVVYIGGGVAFGTIVTLIISSIFKSKK